MGDFRVTINAVGGHGCEREKKDGETVYGCRRMDCPDCITARYVADLERAGVSVGSAVLQHWPNQPTEVVDEFRKGAVGLIAARTRHGAF